MANLVVRDATPAREQTEFSWDRGRRDAVVVYKAPVFWTVDALMIVIAGAIGLVVTEQPHHSTSYHVGVFLLCGSCGLLVPFVAVLLVEWLRAAPKQRNEARQRAEKLDLAIANRADERAAASGQQQARHRLGVIRAALIALGEVLIDVREVAEEALAREDEWKGSDVLQALSAPTVRPDPVIASHGFDDLYSAACDVYRSARKLQKEARERRRVPGDEGPSIPDSMIQGLLGALDKAQALVPPALEKVKADAR